MENVTLGVRLGRQIKAVRRAREWTQEQLAQQCGVQKAQISRIEKDVTHASTELFLKAWGILGPDLRVEEVVHGVIRLQVYPTREAVYTAIPQIIHRVSETNGRKHILLAALHGYIDRRAPEPIFMSPAFEGFVETMKKCIASPSWRVHEVHNITNEERFRMVIGRTKTPRATKYQVRSFSFPDIPQALSPLIIGEEDVLIATEDLFYYGVDRAVHLHGRDYAAMATEYFDRLWNDKRIFRLRSEKGIEEEEIKRFQLKISDKDKRGEA